MRGATWVDAVMLAPRLIEAGHTPERAEALPARVPAWRSALRLLAGGRVPEAKKPAGAGSE